MDNITQWVIWWAIYTLITWKHKTKSLITWAIIANLPDLDIFVSKVIYNNPVDQFFFHRWIAHSLVVSGLIWIFIWFFIWYKNKWDISLWRYIVGVFCSIVFWHLIVDWFTSYSMRYFLPWSEQFYSFDNMPIIDLILLAILVFLFVTYIIVKYKKYISVAIISIAAIWFGSSFIIKDMVKNTCNTSFTKYGLEYKVWAIKRFGNFPNFGSLFNWKCLYITEDGVYKSDYNIFKNNIIRSQVASYNAWSQQELLTSLISEASWSNLQRLNKIVSWTRWYNYITKVWDHKYIVQNLIFEDIWWQWGFWWWQVDTLEPEWKFYSAENRTIWEIIKTISSETRNTWK